MWYTLQNMTQKQDSSYTDPFSFMRMLHTVVLEGLGKNVLRRGAWGYIKTKYLQDTKSINTFFTPNHPFN